MQPLAVRNRHGHGIPGCTACESCRDHLGPQRESKRKRIRSGELWDRTSSGYNQCRADNQVDIVRRLRKEWDQSGVRPNNEYQGVLARGIGGRS